MSTFKNLVGKRINGLFVTSDDTTLVVRTVTNKLYRYDTSGDCCNSVWITHLTGINCLGDPNNSLDLLRGALVTSVEDKGWGENKDDGELDVVQDGFWTITTDRGYIDIEVRNSHNGYYGGSFNENNDEMLSLDEFALVQVIKEF